MKLILLGALLIAVLHDVFTSGRSQASFRQHYCRASWMSEDELVRLIDKVDAAPNVEGYMFISETYEKRGEMRKAMYYLKKAKVTETLEDSEE